MEATARIRTRSEHLGSTAEAVLASSNVPVLLVRSAQRHFVLQTQTGPEIALNRIVLATAFEEKDQHARMMAIDLAGQFSSKLAVVTVMEQISLLRTLLPGTAVKYEETFRENAESAFRALEAQAPGLKIERIVRDGTAYREIVHYSAETEADLLVIGASAKGSWMLGSNAERVARLAPCPILIVG
jgi:nucleotide-binding universal stress UspA family protein